MLTSDEISKLRILLASSGWNDVMGPAIRNRGNDLRKIVFMTPSERPEPWRSTPDDVIRGQIRENAWLEAIWLAEIQAHDHNRRNDELIRQANGNEPSETSPVNQ